MHRFFISNHNLQGEKVILAGSQAHQIRDVLRMQPGDHIIVLDNSAWQYKVSLITIGKDKIIGQIIEKEVVATEPNVQITLYQSVLKYHKFEWILQKCTEIGVAKFAPIITKHSIIQDASAIKPHRLARWRRIITEAAEQSGRGRIPALLPPVNLQECVSSLSAFDSCLIAWTQAKNDSLSSHLKPCGNPAINTVALLVGPEGGFTEQEVQLAYAKGAIPISLGKRILRAETAAIVATSLILYELGQLQV